MPEGQEWSGGGYVTGQEGPDPTETLATKFHRFLQALQPNGVGKFWEQLAVWELHRCPWSRGALRGG